MTTEMGDGVYDGDAPYIEHEGSVVTGIMWHEAGVALFTERGIQNVSENGHVECGMARTNVMDLPGIRYGVRVDAKTARFGNG